MKAKIMGYLPVMSKQSEDESLAFDGTFIKQEVRENDESIEEAEEVKVTLPTASSSTLKDKSDERNLDGEQKNEDSDINRFSKLILEPVQSETDMLESDRTVERRSPGHIVCRGDSDGDLWIVQQVCEEREMEQNNILNSYKPGGSRSVSHVRDIDSSKMAECGLLPVDDFYPYVNMSASVKQERGSSDISNLLSAISAKTLLADTPKTAKLESNGSDTCLSNLLTETSSHGRHMDDTPPLKRMKKDSLIKKLLGIGQEEVRFSNVVKSETFDIRTRKNPGEDCDYDKQSQTQACLSTSALGKGLEKPRQEKCHHCGELLSQGGVHTHQLYHKSMETLKGNVVQCVECKNEIPRRYIKYHVKIHSKEKPFKCGICHKMFVHQRSYQYHIETHTREKQTFSCSICNKEFAHKYLLRRHSVIHEKYVCSICGHYSVDKHRYASHQNKHQTRIYKCDICGKNYSKEAALVSHRSLLHKSHSHSLHVLIMYKCDVCGALFSDKTALRDHVPECKIKKVKN